MLNRMQSRIVLQQNAVYELTQAEQRALPEGAAMVHKMEDGIAKVQRSSGAAGEVFAGFSMMRPGDVDRMTEVYTTDVKEGGLIALRHAANIADMRVELVADDGTRTPLELSLTGTADSPTKGVIVNDGNAIKTDAANVAKRVAIQAAFVPNVVEASAIYGQAPVGVQPSLVGACTVVHGSGQLVATDLIDMSADWSFSNGNPKKLYATTDGRVTTKQTDTPLPPTVVLVEAPTSVSPFALLRTL